MDRHQRVVVAKMRTRQIKNRIEESSATPSLQKKQLLRNTSLIAAVSFCLCSGVYLTIKHNDDVRTVMSHLTAGFEYDDTLGRLQFVSNILPESAMVFLTSDSSAPSKILPPAKANVIHEWNPEEPWIEYTHVGDISACKSGEVMTVVRNHNDEYTVRLLHDNGYESIYSGMCAIQLDEHDYVNSGQTIGTATGLAAFEFRKDGLSVQPVFYENR